MFKRIFSIVLMLAVMCSAFSFTAFAEDPPAAETNPLDDFYPTEDKTVYITGNLVEKCGDLGVTYSAYERTVNIKDKWTREEAKGAAVSYISSDGKVSLPQDYTDIFVTASVTDGTNTYTKDYPMTLTPRGAITYFNDGFENESAENANSKWTITNGTSATNNSTTIEKDTDTNSTCLHMVQKGSSKNQDTVSAAIDSAAKDVDVDSGNIITYFAFKYRYGYQYKSSSGQDAVSSRKALSIAPFIGIDGDDGTDSKPRYYLTNDTGNKFFSQEQKNIESKYTKQSATWHDVAISVDKNSFGMTFDKQQTSPYYKYGTDKYTGTELYTPGTDKISIGDKISIKFDGSTSNKMEQKIDDIILQTITKQQVAQNAIDAYELSPFSGTGKDQTLMLPTTLTAGFGKTAAVTWTLKNTADEGKLEINTDTATATPKVFDGSTVTLTATAKIDNDYTATRDFEVTLPEICGYFGISDIKLVKADGTTEISIPENDAKVSSVKVTKYQNLPEETTAVKLYTAVYNRTTGALSKCRVTDIKLNGFSETDNSQTINLNLDVDENDGTVKCFIWDQNFAPLGKPGQSRKTKLFVCGDSIHCAYPRNSEKDTYENYKYGIGEFLGSHFDSERLEVVNCAKSGDSTKLFKENSWTEKVEKNLCYGDYVYISFGHNDNNMSDPGRNKQVNEEAYKANLKYFAVSAREKGANVIFVTPLSRLCKTGEGTDIKLNDKVDFTDADVLEALQDYSGYMKAVGKENNVPVVDLNELSQKYLDGKYDEAKNCYLITERPTSGDKTHLTKFGAETYAKMVTDALKKINHPLSKIMK